MASLTTIKEGDIIEADVRGRHGYCIVTGKGNRSLDVRPISPGFTWRTVTSHQVVKHWRKTANERKISVPTDVE